MVSVCNLLTVTLIIPRIKKVSQGFLAQNCSSCSPSEMALFSPPLLLPQPVCHKALNSHLQPETTGSNSTDVSQRHYCVSVWAVPCFLPLVWGAMQVPCRTARAEKVRHGRVLIKRPNECGRAAAEAVWKWNQHINVCDKVKGEHGATSAMPDRTGCCRWGGLKRARWQMHWHGESDDRR